MIAAIKDFITVGGKLAPLKDEGGFLQFLLPALPSLISAITGLFRGAPGEKDLTQKTKDNLQLDLNAKQQAQDLRGDLNFDIHELKNLQTSNLRNIGAFDPTSFGEGFGFLGDTVGQFADVDRSAAPLQNMIAQLFQLSGLANQAGAEGTAGALGVEQLLANAGTQAGQGIGQGFSDALGIGLGGLLQSRLDPGGGGGGGGSFLSSLLSGGGAGGGGVAPTFAPSSQGGGQVNQNPFTSQGLSPFIQLLLGIQGGR